MKICTESFQTLNYVREHCTVCLSVSNLCSCVKICDAEEFIRKQLFLCFKIQTLKQLFYYLNRYDSHNRIWNRLKIELDGKLWCGLQLVCRRMFKWQVRFTLVIEAAKTTKESVSISQDKILLIITIAQLSVQRIVVIVNQTCPSFVVQ